MLFFLYNEAHTGVWTTSNSLLRSLLFREKLREKRLEVGHLHSVGSCDGMLTHYVLLKLIGKLMFFHYELSHWSSKIII